MCELCEEAKDGSEHCQDCGVRICFDIEVDDDFERMAYVTASGDLFCRRCGRQYDEEEERAIDEEYGDYFPYPNDIAADLDDDDWEDEDGE